jgi:hypothetical protein
MGPRGYPSLRGCPTSEVVVSTTRGLALSSELARRPDAHTSSHGECIRPRRFTDEQRSNALILYGEHGAAEASRRLPFEVSAATIRQWAKRAALSGPRSARTEAATRGARLGREERAERIAAEALEAAAEFLARARETNPTNARLLMAAFRDALHGSNLLAGDPTHRLEVSDLKREIERELRVLAATRARNAELTASNGKPG